MKTHGKLTKVALAAVVGGAMTVPAGGALAASKTERALIGGVLGAVAGAALSNGDTAATTAGAAAGALLGVATDRDGYRNRSYSSSRTYYRDTRYRNYDRYRQPSYGRYDTRYDSRYAPYRRW